ncbi:putative bifunctional diguanylate cyclase/phosphodiesterase [Asticcacaulis tiandongensis]|uniref:putative bifunctional diguanylate cyclase/phosphodiesterase n=1 Tax=Asticcacaulis tiandongensis TaxID=2565365 RepID=UPI00112CECB1|nr:EAL domain-containing protein [Asticcacaulis tiandongensis]
MRSRSVFSALLPPSTAGWLSRTFSINVAPEDAVEFDRQSVKAIRPFVRAASLCIMLYYAIVSAVNLVWEDGLSFWILNVLSIPATIISALLYPYIQKADTAQKLQIASLILTMLMYANALGNQIVYYEAPSLVYFVLILIVYAIMSPSLKGFVPCALISIGTMLVLAAQDSLNMLHQFLWIALAGTIASLALATTMRMNLLRTVHARLIAEKMAQHDALTGLPNRRQFFDELNRRIRKKNPFDLVVIDLDGFKPVNDVYGHATGDLLLIEVGQRLQHICRERGLVARLGGDEFALILNPHDSDDSLHQFTSHLCDTLRETYILSGGIQARISASAGYLHADTSKGHSGSQLLERADYALYYAKQNLRGAPVLFTERHEAEMRDFSLIDQTLRACDLEAELYVVFQPQYDLVRQKTIGFEALARWQNPKLGEVSPDVFIRAAERSGLISDITQRLLHKAFAAVQDWPEDVSISFNLSTRDLRSARSITRICQAVTQSGITPRRIEFEITETVMLTDFEPALEAVNRLKALGVRIALDDFGSGYSSLGYIHQLPVDKIKIDRTFVTQLLKHDSARKIVRAILSLCSTLGLTHVVEGVESEAECELLRKNGARFIQGYLIARPMASDQVLGYLRTEGIQMPQLADGR